MYYVGAASANETLNAKAKEFAGWIRNWGETLMPVEDYERFGCVVEAKLNELNEKYPRTKAFELYNFNTNLVYVCLKGKPDVNVASMSVYRVRQEYVDGVLSSVGL